MYILASNGHTYKRQAGRQQVHSLCDTGVSTFTRFEKFVCYDVTADLIEASIDYLCGTYRGTRPGAFVLRYGLISTRNNGKEAC